jgi:hypothetical protein
LDTCKLYENRNITGERPNLKQVPTKIISLIKENNELDMELYRFAQELFEKKVDSLDIISKLQLRKYVKHSKCKMK